jgi:hypothetical protein
MVAIVDALKSDAISCIKLRFRNTRHQYDMLAALLKEDSNYSAYKAAVQHDTRNAYIPWHGMQMKNLT